MGMNKEEFLEKLIPYFIESAKATFETMVFMPLTASDPENKHQGQPRGYISGTVGITGSVRDNGMEFNGNISLVFPGELGKVIFRSMMMMEAGDAVEDTELNDVVGELGNMVAGGAKAKLQDEGIDFKIGLPTVVVGNDHHLEPPKKAMVRVVPMQVEAGEFFMEISI